MQLLRKIILASSSEQRKHLLDQIGLQNFEITSPKINENCLDVNLPITKKVVELAYLKAITVKKRLPSTDCIIISGDTEVFRCGKIFSKCSSESQVIKHLSELSGKKHFVYSGICVIGPTGQVFKRFVQTEVYFDRIPNSEFSNKLLINEGVGKAGGYAIQGLAGKFVKKIRGSYSNVVGLSLNHLYKILINIGLKN